MIRVVHCRREEFDEYIGRAAPRFGLAGSKWANPFKLPNEAGADRAIEAQARAEVLAKYEAHVRGKAELMAALHELDGLRIACWCSPKPCHGDVLVELRAEQLARIAGRTAGQMLVDHFGEVRGPELLWNFTCHPMHEAFAAGQASELIRAAEERRLDQLLADIERRMELASRGRALEGDRS
jgi:hypothetical protein